MRRLKTGVVRSRWPALAGAVAVLSACGGSPSGPTPGSRSGEDLVATNEVTVADFSFTPAHILVPGGETVVWTWESGTHNVTFEGGEMTSHATVTAPFIRASVAPTTAGTYRYVCTLHPALMTGSVTVSS
jgi:plastocyanin